MCPPFSRRWISTPRATAPSPPRSPPSPRGGGRSLLYDAPTRKFRLTFYEDAPCLLQEHPDALGIFLVVRGEALLQEGEGEARRLAPAGSAWVRPAALREGAVLPAAPGTLVVWAQSAF